MRNLSPPLQHTAASICGEMQKQSVCFASSIVQCALGTKVLCKSVEKCSRCKSWWLGNSTWTSIWNLLLVMYSVHCASSSLQCALGTSRYTSVEKCSRYKSRWLGRVKWCWAHPTPTCWFRPAWHEIQNKQQIDANHDEDAISILLLLSKVWDAWMQDFVKRILWTYKFGSFQNYIMCIMCIVSNDLWQCINPAMHFGNVWMLTHNRQHTTKHPSGVHGSTCFYVLRVFESGGDPV